MLIFRALGLGKGGISTKAITFNNAYTFPTSVGSVGQVLRVPASGSVLEWFTPTGGGLTSLGGQTGATQTFVNDSNVQISSANNQHTLTWNDQLPVGRGGTGLSSVTQKSYLRGNGTSAMAERTPEEVLSDIGALAKQWADPPTDQTFTGIKRNMQCGGSTMNFGDVGYIASNGKVEFASASSDSTTGCLVMALTTVTSNNFADFLIFGVSRSDSWNWTIGGYVYVSSSGTTGNTLTQTIPTGHGQVVQIIGFALSADVILFNPNLAKIVLN